MVLVVIGNHRAELLFRAFVSRSSLITRHISHRRTHLAWMPGRSYNIPEALTSNAAVDVPPLTVSSHVSRNNNSQRVRM